MSEDDDNTCKTGLAGPLTQQSLKPRSLEISKLGRGGDGVRVDLKLGFACNNRCRFCVQGDKRSRYPELSTQEAKKRLAAARSHSDEVVFTGGEVTIRKDLVDLVAYAKELGFRLIQIQSNGRMLAYGKLVDALVQAGATEFSPALHGHRPELHDYLTRSKGSFEQTLEGLKNLANRRLPVITNTVLTRSNYRHLEPLAELLVENGVTQYQFAFVHALGSAKDDFFNVVPRMELLAPYLMQGLEVGRRAGVRCTTEAIPPCILPGYEEHLAEWVLPDARIYDAKSILESYARYRLNEGKAKGPRCSSCGWNAVCEGPWREYPDHFGWEEFVPVDPVVCEERSPSLSALLRDLGR
jgi:MoaA/NifB/PqqE/SkfB family radical SAM enzyme